MNINYYSKNYDVGEEVKGYVEERIEKFKKYADDADSLRASIKIERTKHQNNSDAFSLSIELEIDGNGYFADKSSSTVFQSFDECEEAINSIIRKEKEKDITDKKRNSSVKEIELEPEF